MCTVLFRNPWGQDLLLATELDHQDPSQAFLCLREGRKPHNPRRQSAPLLLWWRQLQGRVARSLLPLGFAPSLWLGEVLTPQLAHSRLCQSSGL